MLACSSNSRAFMPFCRTAALSASIASRKARITYLRACQREQSTWSFTPEATGSCRANKETEPTQYHSSPSRGFTAKPFDNQTFERRSHEYEDIISVQHHFDPGDGDHRLHTAGTHPGQRRRVPDHRVS